MSTRNSKFFEEITAVERVPRWGGFIATVPDNIAKHIARASIILSFLLELEGDNFSEQEKESALLCLMSRGMLGMITGDVKKRVKEEAELAALLKAAEAGNANKLIENFSLSIQKFFKENVSLYYQDNKLKDIIKAAKDLDNYLFCMREVEIYNNTQFQDKYRLTYGDAKKWEEKFNSVKILLNGITEKNGYYHFLRYVQDMDRVQRWNIKTLIEDNDLIHGFRAAEEAIFLGSLEKFKFKKKVNFYNLVLKCLFHDLQEVVVGDIVVPIKYWNGGEIKLKLNKLEEKASIEMSSCIPNQKIKQMLKKNFTGAMDNTLEGHMCDTCDRLDAVLHAICEVNVGNKLFNDVMRGNTRSLQEHNNLNSLEYFFSYIMFDLIK